MAENEDTDIVFEPTRANDERFPQATAPGAAASAFEPGLIEVQFRAGGAAEMLPQIAGIAPPGNIPSGVQSVLQRHGVQAVESSFGISSDRLAAMAAQPPSLGEAETEDRAGLDRANFFQLRFPAEADLRQIAAELRELPEIERAVPVPKAIPPAALPLAEPLVGTNDQLAVPERQWYAFRTKANLAWPLSSGTGVVLADIDWGYRITHQELAPQFDLAQAFNAFDGGTNVSTGGAIYHGTGVTGLAAAAVNSLGMAGIAFDASVWPIQADSGPGVPLPGNAWARAIDHVTAANSGGKRKVIILEVQTDRFGNYEQVPSVSAAIVAAIAAGVVVCVAAGNGDRDAGLDDSGHPFPPTGSILVGATAFHPIDNVRASFSNWGPQVTISAPGDPSHDLTCGSSADNAYVAGFGGTSGATPKVAAAAALMLQVNSTLTHQQIRTILNGTGTPVISDPGKPVGTFLDVEAAVQAAMNLRLCAGPNDGDVSAETGGAGDLQDSPLAASAVPPS
jgi:hypothetical protein